MENYEEQRRLLQLPDMYFRQSCWYWLVDRAAGTAAKPERCERKHIVHENGYRSMDGDELREMLAYKHKNHTYEEWCSAFCKRKYKFRLFKKYEQIGSRISGSGLKNKKCSEFFAYRKNE
ncbi:MAG: hypothetical protein ACLUTA_02990 [Blautia wexlerae]